LFNRSFKRSRNALLSLQNSDASQCETEKASPSQYDAENELRTISVSTHGDSSIGSICTSNLDSETVGVFHEASGVIGDLDSLQEMIDDNLKNRNVDASQVEMYDAHESQINCGVQNGVCDSNMGTEVGDPHAAGGVIESDVADDSHAPSLVGDSHTEIVRNSHAECTVGNSHAEIGVGDFHSEIGVDNIHTENGTGDSQAEIGVHDFQPEVGVGDFRADDGTDSHSEVGVDNIHIENGTGDSQAEIGVHDFQPEVAVGDFHTEVGAGNFHADDGTDGFHSEIGVINIHTENGVGDSQVEIGVLDSHAEVGVGDVHADDGADDSHSEVGVDNIHTENETDDFQPVIGVLDSHAEVGVGDFHADNGADDSHSEVGVDNIHTENGTGDFQAEIVHDSQAEVGVRDIHAENGASHFQAEMGVSDSHAEIAFCDSSPESGVHNSHARNGVGDCHSGVGIRDLCSEYGTNEDLRSVCGAVGLCSEVKVLDVSQSSGRENTEPDVAVAVSVQSGEENKKTSQVPERQNLISNSSGSKRRVFGRSYSLIVTRSKSRCVLRNKKRVSWLSPDFEYPLHIRQSRSQSRSEGRKVSRSTFSRQKSYKDIFVQNKVMKKIVPKNARKVLANSRCPCNTSIDLSDVRRRFRSGGSFGGTPQKPRTRSVSCSEAVEKPFIFTDEFKDNMLTKLLSQATQKCNTEVVDKPANDINKVTLISNSNNEVVDNSNNVINILTVFSNNSNTSTENHSSGNVEKQTCRNNMITGVDKILNSKVLDHRPFRELCINDIVKMKAKALAARKFRPTSQVEDLQRKMMRELQSLYRPVQS
jgi:hypothetical protein